MGFNKRGQFFLLAAVIIAAVVISLGISANRATVSREPGSFYDYSYEVQRETGAVIDYEIYTDVVGEGGLEGFVDKLAKDIKDRDPDSNFLFVYGSTTDGMDVKNYGTDSANVDGSDVPGGGESVFNKVCRGKSGGCKTIEQPISDFDGGYGSGRIESSELDDDGDVIRVEVSDYDYEFPVSKHRMVIFMMQKDVNDERFVAAS